MLAGYCRRVRAAPSFYNNLHSASSLAAPQGNWHGIAAAPLHSRSTRPTAAHLRSAAAVLAAVLMPVLAWMALPCFQAALALVAASGMGFAAGRAGEWVVCPAPPAGRPGLVSSWLWNPHFFERAAPAKHPLSGHNHVCF